MQSSGNVGDDAYIVPSGGGLFPRPVEWNRGRTSAKETVLANEGTEKKPEMFGSYDHFLKNLITALKKITFML